MTQVALPLSGGDFIPNTLTDLSIKGYRCIPAALNAEGAPQPLGGYREGQQYPSTDPLWAQAAMIAICQPDTLMIDLDGYKQGAADMATIAAYLGITPEQLQTSMVQAAPERQSYHWLFSLPTGASDSIVGNCGKWLPHVDLRLGGNNQLIYVKPGKALSFPPAPALQPLDLSRVLVPFPQRVEVPLTGLPVTLSDSTSVKGAELLREQCDKLRKVTEGGRNAALNDTALIVAHYVGGGEIAQADAEAALTEAALAIGLQPGETAATIRSGISRGVKEPKRCAMTAQEVFAAGLATPTPPVHIAPPTTIEAQWRSGYQLVAGSGLIDHFKGCVYVTDAHRMLTPGGAMLKEAQFNASYGGYVFAIDENGDKTTRKAFEAFVESQCVAFPKVDGAIFSPRHTSGEIVEDEGRRLVNTYIPVNVRTVPGDAGPFLRHMSKLLPDPRDMAIAMAYAAAVVQYAGYKFQWAPLFQGCEGNGKTLLTRCVAYAVGQRYTHMPPASEISEKFNSWLFGSIFIGVEDIYVPDAKSEVLEVLKPMITGDRLAKRAMQQDQVMMTNCANFIFNSNHRNAVKKTQNDRRFCVFFTAQQEAQHLTRDGMDGNYFPDLYDWLKADGYAIVAHYLKTYQIPDELNPVIGCQRAPVTSTTHQAIEASMGGVEQEIMEAIDEGRCGFAGGWVSGYALDNLIEHIRAGRQVPPRKRPDVLKSLGYIPHPALKNGRCNNPVAVDAGRKPKLYIKDGHIHANLQRPAEVERYYSAAQGDPVARGAVEMEAAAV